MIRIAIAGDQHIIRAALVTLLEQEPDFAVVGEAGIGRESLPMVERTQPDVFVMDADISNPQPDEVAKTIHRRCPNVQILLLSAHKRLESVVDLIGVGAAGYVLKDDPPGALVQAIRAVANGLNWVSPRVAEVLVESVKNNGKSAKAKLTGREQDVLQLMAHGRRNAEIAAELGVVEKTVKNHATRIFRKLGVKTRLEAVLFAINTGLVNTETKEP